jgi:SAM-dependent methyltransferase
MTWKHLCCGVLLSIGLCTASAATQNPPTGAPPTQTPTAPPEDPRERWNKVFEKEIPYLRTAPSKLLVEATQARKSGTALDLGMGQGRNAIYLAGQGWDVTGVDISDVAVEQAKKNAAARGVKMQAVVADLDTFEFGTERWDLVTSFYMHAWHQNSKTDIPTRIYNALRPGGLLVMETFRRPVNGSGFRTDELAKAFGRLRILRNEDVVDEPDWAKGEKKELVRFVAEKSPVTDHAAHLPS